MGAEDEERGKDWVWTVYRRVEVGVQSGGGHVGFFETCGLVGKCSNLGVGRHLEQIGGWKVSGANRGLVGKWGKSGVGR